MCQVIYTTEKLNDIVHNELHNALRLQYEFVGIVIG
jgi:hypothetical protein